MLEELEKLKYRGGKDGLLYFVCEIIGRDKIKVRDTEVICLRTPGKAYLSAKELIKYCQFFDWIQLSDDVISVAPTILDSISDKEKLNDTLIISTINKLFDNNILNSDMFVYDSFQSCYMFKNEFFPLSLSVIRNVLISQGFFISLRYDKGTRLYVSPKYEIIVAKHCKTSRQKLSLERLKLQLEKNDIAGEKAELFALSFEKKRIGQPLCSHIKRISEIDVTAGYDIVSFENKQSQELDRFIEVKALSGNCFYWSKKEYEISRLKGNSYYLYLVELNRIDDPDYFPEIIQNPAINVMKKDVWLVETQSYFIRRIYSD